MSPVAFLKEEVVMQEVEVNLKNGANELKPLVLTVMVVLRKMLEIGGGVTGAILFYELVEICKNPDHKPFGNTGDDLKKLTLLSETGGKYRVHDSIRNIVLSAAEGTDLDLHLVSPFAS